MHMQNWMNQSEPVWQMRTAQVKHAGQDALRRSYAAYEGRVQVVLALAVLWEN
jgi:hypothetical protein